jgi:hypothetical protein
MFLLYMHHICTTISMLYWISVTVCACWTAEQSSCGFSLGSILKSSTPVSTDIWYLEREVSVLLLHLKVNSLYLIHDFFITLQYTYIYFIVHSLFHLHTPTHRDSLSAPAYLSHLSLIPVYAKPPSLPHLRNSSLRPSKVTSVI